MRINSIQSHNICQVSYAKRSETEFVDYNLDGFEQEQKTIAERQVFWHDVKTAFSTNGVNWLKTNLWLSSGVPTKRTIKAAKSDPVAFFYELRRPYAGKLIDRSVLAQTTLTNRKTKEKEVVDIKRTAYEYSNAIYEINKGKERLAFVDVDTSELGVVNINYASTIVGREDYRGLFLTLMQAVVEDCINNGYIPTITATPVNVGNKNFDRATLYGLYGAEYKIIDGEYVHQPLSVVSQDKVIEMMENIQKSPKRKFFFEWTEHNFNILKDGG